MRALTASPVLLGAALLLSPASASAEQPNGFQPISERDPYARFFGSFALGRGMRFNNPYRLMTPLGDDGESLSLTASYLDFALGATFGDPDGLQHGAVGHLSVAVQGIAQEVASLSYIALLPLGRDVLGFVRGGVPVVLEPDLGAGLEVAAGGAWLSFGGMGVCTELVSSLFFGAATWDSDPTIIPVISLELGAYLEYEALP